MFERKTPSPITLLVPSQTQYSFGIGCDQDNSLGVYDFRENNNDQVFSQLSDQGDEPRFGAESSRAFLSRSYSVPNEVS